MAVPEVVISGRKWLGEGFISVYTKMKNLMESASKEIVIAVYHLTSEDLKEAIMGALNRGVHITVYANTVDLNISHPFLRVYRVREDMLHAKVLIVDRKKILIGSSNYTFSGFFKNYEIGVFFEDVKLAYRIVELLERLE